MPLPFLSVVHQRKKAQGKVRKTRQEKDALISHCHACQRETVGYCKHHIHPTLRTWNFALSWLRCLWKLSKVNETWWGDSPKSLQDIIQTVLASNVTRRELLRGMLLASATELVKRRFSNNGLDQLFGKFMTKQIAMIIYFMGRGGWMVVLNAMSRERRVSNFFARKWLNQLVRFIHQRNARGCLKTLYYQHKDGTKRTVLHLGCAERIEIRNAMVRECEFAQYCS